MASALLSITTEPFLAGLISAGSMPLGALTSLLWRPRNRTVAFLMAFGAGALLAALVIDLVGSAREKGHLLELGLGAILGSLFFTGVNTLVNSSGGFLRKPSTLVSHLAARRARRQRRLMRELAGMDLWRGLADADLAALADRLLLASCPAGHTLFRTDDPSESLYLLLAGSVKLFDPHRGGELYGTIEAGDSVGRLSFLTGSPHRLAAVCAGDCRLASLTRTDLEELLESSGPFAAHIAATLEQPEVMSYLTERECLSPEQVQSWVGRARQALHTTRQLPDAVHIDRARDSFLQLARHLGKFPVFADLPDDELDQVADRLVHSHYENGHAFFQAGEEADRLFLLERGEVEILDPRQPRMTPRLISAGEAFGELSFVTDADHSVTAVARTPCTAWALRRRDFEELLQRCPALDRAVGAFLATDGVRAYLEHKQGFSPELSHQWAERAMRQMQRGDLIPSARSLAAEIARHGSAPVAIWIGLLMDGIPEALTIGANVILAPLSPSLLAGLLISNYPEALSSSHGMRQQGFPPLLILGMWGALSLLTGVLAALGAAVFANVSDRWVSLVGAMAAGAMLTVISETMLPESYAKGGSVVGLSTVLGFLAIIYIHSLPQG
jgi:CRP-like cAMP-binding protein